MSNEVETQTRHAVEQLFLHGKNGNIDGVFRGLTKTSSCMNRRFFPMAAAISGRDSFLKLFALIMEKYFDDDKLKIDYIAVSGDHAVVIARASGKRGEEVMLAEEMLVKDGKVVEVRIYMHQSPLSAA